MITGSLLGTGSIYGSITFGGLKFNKAAVTASNFSIFRRRRTTSTITINSSVFPGAVYWNNGLANYNAYTLLHELGHVFAFDFGQSSTEIVYDGLPNGDPNQGPETSNAAVMAACGP
jgi:hypothetical protein